MRAPRRFMDSYAIPISLTALMSSRDGNGSRPHEHVSAMQSPIEPHPTDATADAELPLIDQRVMGDWCNDMDREDVLAILARVPDEGARSLADFKKAIAASDLAYARRTAHRLKGMANNLGAARLGRMARAIELGCQSIDDVARQMSLLEQTLGETLGAIRTYS
jgi:HPt (histidine-containing phosphotransfer) domain-containing protein